MIDDNLFGWLGNSIFILAQLIQIIHTYKVKSTKDISFGLQFLWLTGNTMYTVYGHLEKSQVIFIGNLITCGTTTINIGQKIFYDYYYVKNNYDMV